MKLQLKINNEWAVLPEGISMSIHKTSPLFDTEAGDISYPFELNIKANRHIFKNLADTHGYIRLRDFHGLPAEIWYDGMQVFSGQTEVEDSIDFDGENISINIISANKTFSEMIDGMNCRDVEMKDEVVIGVTPVCGGEVRRTMNVEAVYSADINKSWELEKLEDIKSALAAAGIEYDIFSNLSDDGGMGYVTVKGYVNFTKLIYPELPKMLIPVNTTATQTTNTSIGYPFPYCNITLCQPKGGDTADGATGNGYNIIEADGVNAAPNFFVLYFLDCLFKKLGIGHDKNKILAVEDLKRLAMLNTFPRFSESQYTGIQDMTQDELSFPVKNSRFPLFRISIDARYRAIYEGEEINTWKRKNPESVSFSIDGADAIATSENFPDVDVKDVIGSLEKGFGVVFNYDQATKQMELLLKRDIMRSSDIFDSALTVEEEYITRTLNKGIKLSYGNDDNVAYNYDTLEASLDKYGSEHYDDYQEIVEAERKNTDTSTKFDDTTGNTYRIKVNEDTGGEPQLFEVGGYNPSKYGVNETDDEEETIEIPFLPVTVNDIWMFEKNQDNGDELTWQRPSSQSDSRLAVFVEDESFGDEEKVKSIDDKAEEELPYSKAITETVQSSKISDDKKLRIFAEWDIITEVIGPAARNLESEDGYALEKSDIGLQLGILRGGGSDAHIEYIRDYDGEGNDTWLSIPASRASFTPDSVTMWGTPYDYNGTEQGGTDGHISLKLDARKVKSYDENGDPVFYPIDAANARRGLVPQLLEEYLYFLAHKTPVTLKVHGTLTELLRLPFLKRVKIGDHIGFIYTIDFDIEEDGAQEATIVLWELNK